ncbi:Fe-S cluster assembly protein SufD [Kordiimonas sediminis]|uniref:Fe-S cluster assembly protein SufD n=1 Tax=Kordiimonas sediminis TaxID=1735581 RepID=A0A919E2I5_9PROT|nr:Fe-S cluster assembly protein SufD [Kordiimonas sediminis]GHF12978.1 Fe-S cluster assembly protein SufD [Kordiimonas sediminis]
MTATVLETYQSQLESVIGAIPCTDALRRSAMDKALTAGLPTPKDEDWRYSDLKPFRTGAFALSKAAQTSDMPIQYFADKPAARLVFINGQFSEERSDLGTLSDSVRLKTLTNHCQVDTARADDLLEGVDALDYLNTALMRDGIVISVPAGVHVTAPVELINLVTNSAKAATHTRHLIELGENASLTLIEQYVGDATDYWSNPVMQVRMGEGARFDHIRMQSEGSHAVHTGKLYVDLDARATYRGTSIMTGAALSRLEITARILGTGAHADINGAALAAPGQSHDTITRVDHRIPGATSEQIYRTIADKRAKSSFQGKITVAVDAQETAADQSFKALLLDRTGEANAKPELEIFADDVKCSHGATVGELDTSALFYLTSRGIDPDTAQQMLVEAFTGDALIAVEDDDLRNALMDNVSRWMQERSKGGTQ